MKKSIAFTLLMVAWVALCSCSDNNSGIPYELKTACLVEGLDDFEYVQAASLLPEALRHPAPQNEENSVFENAIKVDTVYFRKKENGAVYTELKIATYCGLDFSLQTKKVADTLFVDTEYDGNERPSCSCTAVVDFEVPDDMSSAKILYKNRNRNFPTVIIHEY